MCKRYINWLPLTHPQLGTWLATQAYTLTGNRTSNLSDHRPALNPLSHTSRGPNTFLKSYLPQLSYDHERTCVLPSRLGLTVRKSWVHDGSGHSDRSDQDAFNPPLAFLSTSASSPLLTALLLDKQLLSTYVQVVLGLGMARTEVAPALTVAVKTDTGDQLHKLII